MSTKGTAWLLLLGKLHIHCFYDCLDSKYYIEAEWYNPPFPSPFTFDIKLRVPFWFAMKTRWLDNV